jgi:hypothetical protein
VAQWIRHRTTNAGIAGSTPVTIKIFYQNLAQALQKIQETQVKNHLNSSLQSTLVIIFLMTPIFKVVVNLFLKIVPNYLDNFVKRNEVFDSIFDQSCT